MEGSYLAQSLQALLLGVGVDIGSNEEPNNVEEGHPGVLGEEFLGKGQGQRRGDPADLHDRHETGLDGRANLVEGAGSGNDGHGSQVDDILDRRDLRGECDISHCARKYGRREGGCFCSRTYNQVANQNLEDLGLEAGAAGKDLLKNADQNVAERRADEHAVERHLGNAGAEVVAMLSDIMGDPRGEQFLQTRQHTGGEHLGAQWVGLELAKVGLR